MKPTSVRVCMVVVFCLMFSSVRTSQMAAAAAITHRGEPNLLYEDPPFSTLIHGYCTVMLQGRLTGGCAGYCVGGYDFQHCPSGAISNRTRILNFCGKWQLVDYSRPCAFTH